MGKMWGKGELEARDAARKAAAEAKRQRKADRRRYEYASCLIEDKIDRSRQGVSSKRKE